MNGAEGEASNQQYIHFLLLHIFPSSSLNKYVGRQFYSGNGLNWNGTRINMVRMHATSNIAAVSVLPQQKSSRSKPIHLFFGNNTFHFITSAIEQTSIRSSSDGSSVLLSLYSLVPESSSSGQVCVMQFISGECVSARERSIGN